MKRIFLFILFLFALIKADAQFFGVPNLTTFDDRKIHFGFTLGINTLDFAFNHYNSISEHPLYTVEQFEKFNHKEILDSVNNIVRADVGSLSPGFTVGIVSNLRLNKDLDLRFIPGLSFGDRKVYYNIPIYDSNESGISSYYVVRSTFLDFPLMIKYKAKRIVNGRPYLIGGLAYRINIAKSGKENLLRVDKSSFYVETGFGWDSYLQFFRLSTELKYSFGLGNELSSKLPGESQNPYYQMALKSLNSHIVTLCFHFE